MKKILFIGLILSTAACATRPSVETQCVPIFSHPEGAEVTVNGLIVGTTPMTVLLEKNQNHMITITKFGFKPEAVPIEKKTDSKPLSFTSVLRSYQSSTKSLYHAPFRDLQGNEDIGDPDQLFPKAISINLQKSESSIDEDQKKVAIIDQVSHLG